jgi:hypothetical protein
MFRPRKVAKKAPKAKAKASDQAGGAGNLLDVLDAVAPPKQDVVTTADSKEGEGVFARPEGCPAWVAQRPIKTLALVAYTEEGGVVRTVAVGQKLEYAIGRDEDNDVRCDDVASVSRRHCLLYHGTPPGSDAHLKHSATLVDLGSVGGTYYKKSTAREASWHLIPAGSAVVLRPEMVLRFGQSRTLFQVQGLQRGARALQSAVQAANSQSLKADISMGQVVESTTAVGSHESIEQQMKQIRDSVGSGASGGASKRIADVAFSDQAEEKTEMNAKKRQRTHDSLKVIKSTGPKVL